jgi:hypothetical protein
MKPTVAIRVFVVLLLAGLAARPAAAQSSSTPLADLLPNLLTGGVTLAPPTSGVNHTAHFVPAADDPIFPLVSQFNTALVASLATFPLGSSSGGFVFEGDPALGDFRPASRSFGPTFAERALTSGKGNVNFGFTFQRAKFDSFEGKTLDDGSVKFYIRHTNCCPAGAPDGYPNPAFEADLVREDLTLKLDTNTTAFLFNYGVTDRLDIGAAIPIVHVSIEAGVLETIDRLTTAGDPSVHHFAGSNPDQEQLPTVTGSTTGLGDVVVRAKYRFLKAPGGGLAAGVDLRLPTGDENNLLGLGATQAKFLFIASREMGNVAVHGNFSYAVAGTSDVSGDIPKEIGYTAGAEVVVGRATLAFDLIGRTLRDTVRFADATQSEPIDTLGNTVSRTVFSPSLGNLNQVLGVAGVKYPVLNHLLITANALFSLNDAGLKANFIPVIGLEYVFPRH